MSREEARRNALVKLGGLEQTKLLYRQRRSLPLLETFLGDIQIGVRSLVKSRGVALVSVLVLALGIGASTSLYSVWKAALMFPFSYQSSGRWVAVLAGLHHEQARSWFFSVAEYNELSQLKDIFESTSVLQHVNVNLTDSDRPEAFHSTAVTANAIAATGVAPILGRSFRPGDDAPGPLAWL
jgi:hypothetical protein